MIERRCELAGLGGKSRSLNKHGWKHACDRQPDDNSQRHGKAVAGSDAELAEPSWRRLTEIYNFQFE
jgi:hypothetical protein